MVVIFNKNINVPGFGNQINQIPEGHMGAVHDAFWGLRPNNVEPLPNYRAFNRMKDLKGFSSVYPIHGKELEEVEEEIWTELNTIQDDSVVLKYAQVYGVFDGTTGWIRWFRWNYHGSESKLDIITKKILQQVIDGLLEEHSLIVEYHGVTEGVRVC